MPDRYQTLMIEDRETVSKSKKKRIRWSRSSSPKVVGYRLYWSLLGEVNYDSEFIDIGDRTEVILPHQVPPLHHVQGEIALGITALNRAGNESDLVRFSVHFGSLDQGVPRGHLRLGTEEWEPPSQASVLVDDLHFWLIKNPSLEGEGQTAGTQDYYIESHHVEESPRWFYP